MKNRPNWNTVMFVGALSALLGFLYGLITTNHAVLGKLSDLNHKLDRALELNTIDTALQVELRLNAEAKLADMEIIHSSEAELEDLKKRYNTGGILGGVVMK